MILLVLDLAAILSYYIAFVNGATAGDFITYVPPLLLFGMIAYAWGAKRNDPRDT
jgi:hypothetical protein